MLTRISITVISRAGTVVSAKPVEGGLGGLVMIDEDLQQRDLSHLEIQQMSAAERAEMRRRYDSFLQAMRPRSSSRGEAPKPASNLRRWVPNRRR